MTAAGWILLGPMWALLIWSAVTDLRGRIIPNWLTLPLLVSGLLAGGLGLSGLTLGASLYGALTGFGLSLVMFLIGNRGGGDVKLLTGVGAWIGPWSVLIVFLLSAILSMILAVAQAAAQGRLAALFKGSLLVAGNTLLLRQSPSHEVESAHAFVSVGQPVPHAISVLIAVAAVLA